MIRNRILNISATKFSSLLLAALMLSAILDALLRIARQSRLQWIRPMLYWDSWTFVLRENSNLFKWILSQHNEHRIVWSRLSSIIETDVLKIPPTSTSIAQTFLLTVANISILFFVCRTVQKRKIELTLLWLSSSLVLINPWQFLNFYWEFQTPWIFANTLVLASTLFLCRYSSPGKLQQDGPIPLLVSAVIPWIAIYNSGQGFAICASFIVISLLMSKRLSAISLCSTLAASFIYFRILSYAKPAHHPPIHFDPVFFATELLGGEFTGAGVVAIILIFYLLMNFNLLQLYRKVTLLNPALLLPELFSVFFVLINTLSRSGLGLLQAKSSHYVSHTLMLVLTLILITAFALESLSLPETASQHLKKYDLISLALIVTIIFAFPQSLGYGYLDQWRQGGNFYWRHSLNFQCEASKTLYPQSEISLLSKCRTDQKWPTAEIRPQYFKGALPVKPLGWHLKAGMLSEPIKQ